MKKRIGNIETEGSVQKGHFGDHSLIYHCNDHIKKEIPIRSIEDVRDIKYAMECIIREYEGE